MNKGSQSIRILIADDHPIFRVGLRTVLESQKDFQVVGEAADGAEAVKLALKLKPDIFLLDLEMPKASGLEVLRQLSASRSSCRTLLVATTIEKEHTLAAIQLGARGVVLKETIPKLLLDSIRWVLSERFWVGRDRVADLIHAIQAVETTSDEPDDFRRFGLTPRERQIIAAILGGYTNKDAAKEFSISQETVKRHLSSIFDKLGVSNRLELALFAIHHGLTVEKLGLGGAPPSVLG
jgi:two-component system nitrate/nitrite response regulator NarL